MSALNQAFLRAYTKDSRGARPASGPGPASTPSPRQTSAHGESIRHEPAPRVPEPHMPESRVPESRVFDPPVPETRVPETPAPEPRVPESRVSESRIPAAAKQVAREPIAEHHDREPASQAFETAFDATDQIALAAAFGAIHNVTAVDNLGDWTSISDTLSQHALDAPPASSMPAPAAPDPVATAAAAPPVSAPVSAPVEVRAAPVQQPEPTVAAPTESAVAAPVASSVAAPVAAPSVANAPETHGDAQSPPTIDSRLESRLQRVTAPRPVFVAAWEVDAFQWPSGCNELLESCHDEFHLAAARFRTATIEGLRVLAVTSLLRREGRSTVAMALARAAAMEGIRVALLDADLDHPNLGSALGFQASVGWPDVLRENIPLSEAAVNSLADRLTLFPLANPPRRWPMALNTPEVSRLLRDLGQTFELVIVDLGPLAGPASRGFEVGDSCPIDAALLVQDVRITTSDQARISAYGLRQAGIGAVGIIENFAAAAATARGE